MFIFLLVIPFCKAADPDQSWYQAVQNVTASRPDLQQELYLDLAHKQIPAIPANLNLPQLQGLNLGNNQIYAIPANLALPNLTMLLLHNNHIDYVDPQIINQFPRLNYLHLNKNPLTQKNVDELRAAAQKANRVIQITANDIGDQYSGPGIRIKPAKR